MVGSTESYDRVKDRMLMAGVILANYLKNPIILPNHNYMSQAIGKAIEVRIEGAKLIFKIQFAETDLGKEWYYLYANKYMNASSIGFDPSEYTLNSMGGYDFTKWELLELSLVTIPCNPEAIQRAYEDGHISKSLYESIKKEDGEEMTSEEIKALMGDALKPITEKVKGLEENKIKADEQLTAKNLEIVTLTAKIKELEDKVVKSGATLSKSTVDALTNVVEGIKEHAGTLAKFIKDCSQKEDDGGDDSKEYSADEIQKLIKEKLESTLKEGK